VIWVKEEASQRVEEIEEKMQVSKNLFYWMQISIDHY
jgi:hypothetical protein